MANFEVSLRKLIKTLKFDWLTKHVFLMCGWLDASDSKTRKIFLQPFMISALIKNTGRCLHANITGIQHMEMLNVLEIFYPTLVSYTITIEIFISVKDFYKPLKLLSTLIITCLSSPSVCQLLTWLVRFLSAYFANNCRLILGRWLNWYWTDRWRRYLYLTT